MLGLQRFAGTISAQFLRRTGYCTTVRTTTASISPTTGTIAEEATETDVSETSANKPKNSLVAAAFQSLKDDSNNNSQKEFEQTARNVGNIDETIINAKTVNGLLSITETSETISRKHALKIVSILAEWSTINRVKLSEFENDSRFIRICRILGRTVGVKGNGASKVDSNNKNQKAIMGFRTDDLNTVLGVAGDDEAAKLIASISLHQMVKVMSTLAQRRRRSTPLLRSLAFNISSNSEHLDLKQCADVLFAMATLNFQDSVLAAKICADIQTGLPNNSERSAVVGSILTSLGLLKYRDLDILEALTQWILQHSEICRLQDVTALFYSSAILNFKSVNTEEMQTKLIQSVEKKDFTKPVDWLNYVWSLTILGMADISQINSVLSEDFLKQLQEYQDGLSPKSKMKLLNMNSFAQLLGKDYKGAKISTFNPVYDVLLSHSKSKQLLVNGMVDALKSLLPASCKPKTLVDSKMGFLIDAICQFDSKRNPLPMDKEYPNAIKVALMIVDFHDHCQGTHRAVCGLTNLTFDLLEKSGYKVLAIPYNEFNTSDKLLKRVQYLEAKFKAIVSSK